MTWNVFGVFYFLYRQLPERFLKEIRLILKILILSKIENIKPLINQYLVNLPLKHFIPNNIQQY